MRSSSVMSSKRTRGTKTALASDVNSLRGETERLIAKEWYKDAVKQAKLCYKEESTPENHRLLERAYFLRARQLAQWGCRLPRSRWPSICSNSA